jgi:hypothetical protein
VYIYDLDGTVQYAARYTIEGGVYTSHPGNGSIYMVIKVLPITGLVVRGSPFAELSGV